jgi:hypothetical protein
MGIHDGTRIARYGESFPDTFAGRWKEPDDSWVVVFTDEVDHHSAAIRKLVYAPTMSELSVSIQLPTSIDCARPHRGHPGNEGGPHELGTRRQE